MTPDICEELGDPRAIPLDVIEWARGKAGPIRDSMLKSDGRAAFSDEIVALRPEAREKFPNCRWAVPLVRLLVLEPSLRFPQEPRS